MLTAHIPKVMANTERAFVNTHVLLSEMQDLRHCHTTSRITRTHMCVRHDMTDIKCVQMDPSTGAGDDVKQHNVHVVREVPWMHTARTIPPPGTRN